MWSLLRTIPSNVIFNVPKYKESANTHNPVVITNPRQAGKSSENLLCLNK